MAKDLEAQARRKAKVRRAIRVAANGRPRLSVHRTSQRSSAHVIDDARGEALAAASSVEKDLRGSLKTGADTEAAKTIGKLVAERAMAKGVTAVVFDRGAYIYHGRVKALAEGAREGGLQF